jgi:hypothetical protein
MSPGDGPSPIGLPESSKYTWIVTLLNGTEERVVRDRMAMREGWVVFGNGPEMAVMTQMLAFPTHNVQRNRSAD